MGIGRIFFIRYRWKIFYSQEVLYKCDLVYKLNENIIKGACSRTVSALIERAVQITIFGKTSVCIGTLA